MHHISQCCCWSKILSLCFCNTGNRTMDLLQIYNIGIVSRTWLISSAKWSLHINLAEEKGHIKVHELISWDSVISYEVTTGCVFLELLSEHFFCTLYAMHGDAQKAGTVRITLKGYECFVSDWVLTRFVESTEWSLQATSFMSKKRR